MAITIKGVRLDTVNISKEGDDHKIGCNYSLISSVDKVLAKQTVGGYGSLELKPSASTLKALDDFMRAYRGDLNSLLGIEAE